MTRPYEQRDLKRAAEYVKLYHPKANIVEFQAPLADIRDFEPGTVTLRNIATFSRLFPRADILIKEGTEWTLVECKSNAQIREIAQLDFYLDALRHDITRRIPERDVINRVFVTDREDDRIRRACEQRGIKFVVL